MKEESSPSVKQVLETAKEDYQLVEKIIRGLENHPNLQPSLKELATAVGLSTFQFQRLFSRWVGISPKRFCQYLTKEYAQELLLRSSNVLDTTYESGLSSPSRLHDLFLITEAVRPGDIRTRGKGLEIRFGFHPSPFGNCLIGVTEKGVCTLRFTQEGLDEEALVLDLEGKWPAARILYDPYPGEALLDRVFPYPLRKLTGSMRVHQNEGSKFHPPGPLHLYIQGTNFQLQVWQALLRIPLGAAASYAKVAQLAGNPNGMRAVGSAVGANLIPFLIPCHRVLRKNGEFGNYGEGPFRKKAILAWEAAMRERL